METAPSVVLRSGSEEHKRWPMAERPGTPRYKPADVRSGATILEPHSDLFSPLWHEGVQSSLPFRKDRRHTYHVNLWRDAMSPCGCQVTAKPWVSVKWKCIIWTEVSFCCLSRPSHARLDRADQKHLDSSPKIYRCHTHTEKTHIRRMDSIT